LGKLGRIVNLPGSDGLLLLQVDKKSSGAKAIWEQACKLVGTNGTVKPVLVGEDGTEQYPTGEITVRFNSTPTDAQLKRFAASHKMRLRNRNEYVPQQAVFEPLDPNEQYIPDLVAEVSSAKDIQLAWANTLVRYQKM